MPEDRGAYLRSLYQTAGGVKQVFSSKVADYIASRPDYPAPLFEMLRTVSNLQAGSVVVDIGAGTGLLTRGLLQQGYCVVAVEPNAAMRNASDFLLSQFSNYCSVAGSAESMSLASASADLITAAQSSHWFEPEQAKAECLRVLRLEGKVALIWNDRLFSDPLQVALDQVFAEYGGSKRAALAIHEQQRNDIPTFFGETVPNRFSYPHEHLLDEAGLISLVFSRSYMPDRESSAGQKAKDSVCQIFQRFSASGVVKVRYVATACVGRPHSG